MSRAKTGILLLYAAAVVESTRLQATAVVIGNILSPYPLTVPPILVHSSENHQQQHQQEQRRGSSGNCRDTQVLREWRTTCRSVGTDYGQRCERRKYTGQTHNRISCTKCLDSTLQSALLAARSDNTSKRMTDGSIAAHGSYSLYEVNHVSCHGEDTTGKSGSAGRESKDSRIWETRGLASIDSGTRRRGTGFRRCARRTNVSNYVVRSTTHSKNPGNKRRVVYLALGKERKQCTRPFLFIIPGQHRLRIPQNSLPPSPVVGFRDGRVQRRGAGSRVRAAEGLNATTTSAGSSGAKNSAAAALSVFTESWLPHTFRLSLSLSASAAMRYQQANFLPLCPLYLLFMTRMSRGAAAPASASHLDEGRRHVFPAAATPHARPYHSNLSYTLTGKQTPILRVASPNSESALSNACMPPISPAHYSFSHVSSSAHSLVLSFISSGTATTSFLLRRAPRLCGTSAPLTSSSHSPVRSSSACAKVSAPFISSSRAASSLLPASSASFPSPSRSAASSPVRLASAWLSSLPRIQPAPAALHPSLCGALFSRSPPSSWLGSLLSPCAQTNMQPEHSEKLKEKLKYIAALVQATPVILFMKGTPMDPACGFSRVTYQLLELAANQANEGNGRLTPEDAGTRSPLTASTASASTPIRSFRRSSSHSILSDPTFFRFINVLEDDLMREGIKQYSEWPTIPQLYICGQFVGGADITAAMFRDNSLQSALRKALVAMKPQCGAGL